MPGQGGLAFTGFTGLGLGVAFGGWGVARGVARGVGAGVARGVGAGVARGVGAGVARGVGAGVARGVGAGVARGVGAGVAAGGRVAVGFAVGLLVGGLVGPATGRDDGALGPMATWPLGSGVTVRLPLGDGTVEGGAVGVGVGVEVPGDSGAELVVVGPGLAGVAEGGTLTTGVGESTATSPGPVRGAPIPTASANVARTRLRTPRATTSRARWAEVTSLVLSFRPAFVGRSVLSRTREC